MAGNSKKDFSEVLQNPEIFAEYQPKKQSKDPNIYLNEPAKQEIKSKHNFQHVMTMASSSFLSILTAPFVTLHVSLQLSVKEHQNKYGQQKQDADLKALGELKKEITVQDRRKFELLIKSGSTGTNQPFRAPVYLNYQSVFKGLSNQGVLAFYKGNLIGLLHTNLNSYLRFHSFDMLEYENLKFYKEISPLAKSAMVTAICSALDVFLHPLQTAQSRFILQNRLPNFSLYKSLYTFFKKHKRGAPEIMQGWKAQIFRNILMTFTWVNYIPDKPKESFILSSFLSHTLGYPIMTVIRRLQCQSNLPGMIPLRYSGAWQAFKLILKEEGIKGLYRGFISYCIAHGLSSYIIISMNQFAVEAYDQKFA